MIAVVIEAPDALSRRKVFGRGRAVAIGSSPDNDIVLVGDGVAEYHAQLDLDASGVLVSALAKAVVSVDGRPIKRDRRIRGDMPIAIGRYTLRIIDAGKRDAVDDADAGIVRTGATAATDDAGAGASHAIAGAGASHAIAGDAAETDDAGAGASDAAATERRLLAAIAGDEASRLVYADWLEQRGDAIRAEFVRVQHRLGVVVDGESAEFEQLTDRLRELGAHVSTVWRAQVARPAIEGCDDASFDFQCPKQWSSLEPTDHEKVRFCGTCKSSVFYSASIAEARRHAAAGACVAIDLQAARWDGDLVGPFGANVCPSCRLDVGPTSVSCPRCGTRVRAMMLRGRMVVIPNDPQD